MATTFQRLGVGLQTIAGFVQQIAHNMRAHLVSMLVQCLSELASAFARPPQRRDRIAARVRIDQRLKIGQQARIAVAGLLATTAHPPDPIGRCVWSIHLLQRFLDGGTRDARGTCHPRNATVAQRPRLRRQDQTALLLVQMRQNSRELLCQKSIIAHTFMMPSWFRYVNLISSQALSCFSASIGSMEDGTRPASRWWCCDPVPNAGSGASRARRCRAAPILIMP